MIDPLNETVISLTDAARALPARRGGKRPHVSCLYRWTVRGCKGVVLESIEIGGTRCTSREALARFFERLTAVKRGEAVPDHQTPVRTAAQRLRASEAAAKKLQKMGV